MFLKDFREPLRILSFELIYFRIPFVIEQRIVEALGIKFWALLVHWVKTLIFLSPLGSLKF